MTTLESAGKKLRLTRNAQTEAYEEARIAALAALSGGVSESEVAAKLGVDRMTVRKWQGKR
jgi:transposase